MKSGAGSPHAITPVPDELVAGTIVGELVDRDAGVQETISNKAAVTMIATGRISRGNFMINCVWFFDMKN